MRDHRVLAQGAVLRAQIATANKLIAEHRFCQSTLGHRPGNKKPA
jgi:hypothetical protein